MTLRIIVTGGRHAYNPSIVHDWLDQLLENIHREIGDTLHNLLVAQGGATGVDKFVRDWCMKRGVDFVNYPYPKQYGRAGGPIRNREMAIKHRPYFVVAFPGGKGTRSMMTIARELNIPVIVAGLT